MVHAYVFITAQKAEARQVADVVEEFSTVKSAHVITGDIDVVAFIEAPDLGGVWDTVAQIQGVPGVTRTTTSLVVDPP